MTVLANIDSELHLQHIQ